MLPLFQRYSNKLIKFLPCFAPPRHKLIHFPLKENRVIRHGKMNKLMYYNILNTPPGHTGKRKIKPDSASSRSTCPPKITHPTDFKRNSIRLTNNNGITI